MIMKVNIKIFKNKTIDELWDDVSDEAKDLVSKLMSPVEKRITTK